RRPRHLLVEPEILETPCCYVPARCPKHKSGDAGPAASCQTHRAWLATGVHDAVLKQVPLQLLTGTPQCHDFRVRGWVAQLYDTACPLADDHPVHYHDRSERRLTLVFQGMAGNRDRSLQELLINVVQGGHCLTFLRLDWCRLLRPRFQRSHETKFRTVGGVR